jgi:hypothetical protein
MLRIRPFFIAGTNGPYTWTVIGCPELKQASAYLGWCRRDSGVASGNTVCSSHFLLMVRPEQAIRLVGLHDRSYWC